MILLDSDYSPAADLQASVAQYWQQASRGSTCCLVCCQAVARAHRCGQDKTVRVIRLISAHTVEEVRHRSRTLRIIKTNANACVQVVLLKGLQKLKLSSAVMVGALGGCSCSALSEVTLWMSVCVRQWCADRSEMRRSRRSIGA